MEKVTTEMLTLDELAALLKVDAAKVYEMTRKRHGRRRGFVLPKFQVGRELRFRRKDVEDWIERSVQTDKERC